MTKKADDVFERTRKVIELSDEIAAINMRMAERSMGGREDDAADRGRLAELLEELQASKASPG